MKFSIFLSALFWVLLLQINASSSEAFGGRYPEKTIAKAVKYSEKTWSKIHNRSKVGFELESMDLNTENEYYSVHDTLFRFREGESEPGGYLVISSAKGRFDRFDFMILYNHNRKLLEVRVLTYRSEYGSQITSKAWLRKFSELDMEKDIQYGEDIDAISGATFSASSITREINRINKLILGFDK